MAGAGSIAVSPIAARNPRPAHSLRGFKPEFESIILGRSAEGLDGRKVQALGCIIGEAFSDADSKGAGTKTRAVFLDLATKIKNNIVKLASERIRDAVKEVSAEHLPEFLDAMHREMLANHDRADAIPEAMLNAYRMSDGRLSANAIAKAVRIGFSKSKTLCPKEVSRVVKTEYDSGGLNHIEGVVEARAEQARDTFVFTAPAYAAAQAESGRQDAPAQTREPALADAAVPAPAAQMIPALHPAAVWNDNVKLMTKGRDEPLPEMALTIGILRIESERKEAKCCDGPAPPDGKGGAGVAARRTGTAAKQPPTAARGLFGIRFGLPGSAPANPGPKAEARVRTETAVGEPSRAEMKKRPETMRPAKTEARHDAARQSGPRDGMMHERRRKPAPAAVKRAKERAGIASALFSGKRNVGKALASFKLRSEGLMKRLRELGPALKSAKKRDPQKPKAVAPEKNKAREKPRVKNAKKPASWSCTLRASKASVAAKAAREKAGRDELANQTAKPSGRKPKTRNAKSGQGRTGASKKRPARAEPGAMRSRAKPKQGTRKPADSASRPAATRPRREKRAKEGNRQRHEQSFLRLASKTTPWTAGLHYRS
ncbi:MAG: hypothetical protein AB1529_04040 [Candidatus Micrarchaeota archaeon]